MREPVFNETVQLGIVVRDLEATVRRYEDDYGIGPWEFAQIDAGEANNYREYGQPVERSTRIAVATVGRVMWELIEPLDEEGIYMPVSLLRKVRAYITSPSPHRTSMRLLRGPSVRTT
jgi:methylmalonyl-CoA/ethylmalonyl-CoA epimerase